MQPFTTATNRPHELVKCEQNALAELRRGITYAADALITKDGEFRETLIERANLAYERALQLITDAPAMTEPSVQEKLVRLEILLRRVDSVSATEH